MQSRVSIVEAFNKGIFDYLIATDESTVEVTATSDDADPAEAEAEAQAEVDGSKKKVTKTKKRKRKGENASADYNAARGLDFQRVSAVLNFDLPGDVAAYTHRIGELLQIGHQIHRQGYAPLPAAAPFTCETTPMIPFY